MSIAAILEGKGRDVVSIPSTSTVAEAVRLLAARKIGAVPVIDRGQVVGIFSERDVIYCIEREGALGLELPVSQVMTAPAISVGPEEGVLGALALMTRRRIRHLPVVEGEACIGFISIGDLVKYRIDRIESEADAMRAYIQAA
jgi:CBS domain-containing protein